MHRLRHQLEHGPLEAARRLLLGSHSLVAAAARRYPEVEARGRQGELGVRLRGAELGEAAVRAECRTGLVPAARQSRGQGYHWHWGLGWAGSVLTNY